MSAHLGGGLDTNETDSLVAGAFHNSRLYVEHVVDTPRLAMARTKGSIIGARSSDLAHLPARGGAAD